MHTCYLTMQEDATESFHLNYWLILHEDSEEIDELSIHTWMHLHALFGYYNANSYTTYMHYMQYSY